MDHKNPFKWRHFEKEIILLNVRWYLRYPLSYRDLEEMMLQRGLNVDHTTIYQWVQIQIQIMGDPFLNRGTFVLDDTLDCAFHVVPLID